MNFYTDPNSYAWKSGMPVLAAWIVLILGSAPRAAHADVADPGVRHDAATSVSTCANSTMPPFDPTPTAGLNPAKLQLFCVGLEKFRKEDTVVGDGLGPAMNLDSCVGCHAYPTAGGSSPPHTIGNPQMIFLKTHPTSTNVAPPFITMDGPVREARFIKTPSHTPDGGVHAVFTIVGLPGADKCHLQQPNFVKEIKDKNVIFRIPTPLFGTGLIEQIEDSEIRGNLSQQELDKVEYGALSGLKRFRLPVGHLNSFKEGHVEAARETAAARATRKNTSDNDGTIARFGWKAQNKSLLVFAGEAYNVEMGISNELFETERNEDPGCQPPAASNGDQVTIPNDQTDPASLASTDLVARYAAYSDIELFTAFMRNLAPPVPSHDQPGGADSIERGRGLFEKTGCAACHTPILYTSKHSVGGRRPVALFSDLALHDMGSRLADGVTQGRAGPRDFRSAPLWGLGGREYLLHDGRARNLIDAIKWHSSPGVRGKGRSEANDVVEEYKELGAKRQQDLLNFLRSL